MWQQQPQTRLANESDTTNFIRWRRRHLNEESATKTVNVTRCTLQMLKLEYFCIWKRQNAFFGAIKTNWHVASARCAFFVVVSPCTRLHWFWAMCMCLCVRAYHEPRQLAAERWSARCINIVHENVTCYAMLLPVLLIIMTFIKMNVNLRHRRASGARCVRHLFHLFWFDIFDGDAII